MKSDLADLEALVDLARETSSEKRRHLLRKVTDLFLADPTDYSEQQSHYFGEIMYELAYDLENQVREELAKRLAPENDAPHIVVRALASDDIAVAQPILTQSSVLTQQDLIEISKEKDQQHLIAITKREDIGEALSDVIVERGDDDTVESLLRNAKAQFANETVQKIAIRAQSSEQLQEPLIDRNDVSENVIISLYSHVAENLKQKILDNSGYDKETIEPLIETITGDFTLQHAQLVQERIDRMAESGALNEALLVRFLKEKQPLEFLLALAKIAELDVTTARRVIEDKTGKSLVVVCKATKFSPITFKEIATSSLTNIAPHPTKLLPLITIYNRFQPEDAKRVIRFWRTRKHAMETENLLEDEAATALAKQG
ncbi:MAG: DUF2336 domain-containing protein [Pseudomonadota bacterium]